MSILVTGGCGFVGTALTQSLLSHEERVISMDICPPKIIKDQHLQQNNVFVQGDITVRQDLEDIFQSFDIKAVFHVAGFGLAGTTNLPAFNRKTKEINVYGTQNVIEACKKFNVKALGKQKVKSHHFYSKHVS